MSTRPSLREQTRRAVKDHVAQAAWGLFARQGFEATTVNQIAEAAGMSYRSFFRYFEGKDGLLLERLLESGGLVVQALEERPAGEAPWPALRAALDEVVCLQEKHPDRTREVLTMFREPAVSAILLERQRRWQAMLAPLVLRRLAHDAGDPVGLACASALAGCAVACLDAASEAWITQPGLDLRGVLTETMSAVAPLGP
ncbi:putative Transcriptional regulator [metagenome]|uniref:Putative Transcriptional regulator n=1 Tax=metagenome TaxID=256318 RepID=A0A2P2C1A5_9ZZZZ